MKKNVLRLWSAFLVFGLCAFVTLAYAQGLAERVKAKAEQAKTELQDAAQRGSDISAVIEKMKMVKTLGQSGKLAEANAQLDEVLKDFQIMGENMQQKLQGSAFVDDRKVEIKGYDDDAMEAFISRDGRYLFFNSMNTKVGWFAKGGGKDIFYAEKINNYTYQFKGAVKPINTDAVEGVPTMDRDGNFYFVSTKAYKPNNLVTVYHGKFQEDGTVVDIRPVPELSLNQSGWLNMDSEISADGQTLYSTQSYFERGANMPSKSYFFYALKDGDKFVPQADSDDIFKTLNKDEIVYGITVSSDELEVLYTRLLWDKKRFESLRATRPNKNTPFDEPEIIHTITGFSEAPALSEDEQRIYYHKKAGAGRFDIHVLHRRP